MAAQNALRIGHQSSATKRRDRLCDCRRDESASRSGDEPLSNVRPRTFRRSDRADTGARRSDGAHHLPRLHHRRVGRSASRGYGQQRDKELPFKGCWDGRPGENPAEWTTRPRNKPGAVYKYNDTRVNVLALAALNVWRRPLPQVLKEDIMDPIGASNSWRWFGYENSWVVLDGIPMQSVTGGGHFGGGMYINAYDMGRFG